MELPLFPLHLVLFPGRPLPLHLFEPRYRQMLRDCLAGERTFGVVAIRSGREGGGAADVFDVGTIARVDAVDERADGRYDIVTRGTRRFRIHELLYDRPYLRGEVEPLEEAPCDADAKALADDVLGLLGPYLTHLGAPEEVLAQLPREPAALGWLAAAFVQIEVPEQQRLLELDRPADRLSMTKQILRRESGFMRHLGTVASLRPPGPGGAQLN